MERKVFQGGIEIMIYLLTTLEEDRVVAGETEQLRKMMNTKKETGGGEIPAIMQSVQARIKLAYMYLVSKGIVGENDRKGDNSTAFPVSNKIFYHAAFQAE